jgi:hypothetical protein
MPALSRRPWLRRLTVLLATIQVAAVAAAPMAEALDEHATGTDTIESGHSAHCARVHQPATCVTCQLTASGARVPERAQVSLPAVSSVPIEADGPGAAPSRAPPGTPQSRAPPDRSVA